MSDPRAPLDAPAPAPREAASVRRTVAAIKGEGAPTGLWHPVVAIGLVVAILTVSASAGRMLADALVDASWTGSSPAGPSPAGPPAVEAGGRGSRVGLPFTSMVGLLAAQAGIVVLVMVAVAVRGPLVAGLGLGDARRALPRAMLAALALLALATPLSLGVSALLGVDPFADLRGFVSTARSQHAWLLLLVAGLGAPLAEELLFRGFLLTALARSRLGFPASLVLTTLAWTWLHWPYTALGLAAVFAVGLYLGWLYRRTGSLWVAIGCHALYNLALVITIRYVDLPAPP